VLFLTKTGRMTLYCKHVTSGILYGHIHFLHLYSVSGSKPESKSVLLFT